MAKNIIISFYDVCFPDYFGGHHLPVLQCPVDGATTRKDLYNSLLSDLNEGYVDYQFKYQYAFELPHEETKQAIKDCIFWNDDCKDSDIVFPGLEIWTEEEDESSYAFFVVRCEEEESE